MTLPAFAPWHRPRRYQADFFMSHIKRWVSPVIEPFSRCTVLSQRGLLLPLDYCNLDYDGVACESRLEYAIESMIVCTHMHVSVFVWHAEGIKISEWAAGSGWWMVNSLIACVSACAYLPPPDQQSDPHGEQHDQGGHGHDHDDHHWTLLAGRKCHWKWQDTLVTHVKKNTPLNRSRCADTFMHYIVSHNNTFNTPACIAHIFNYWILREQGQEMRANNKAMTLKAELI